MAVRSIDDIMNIVKNRIGDSTNDDDLSFVEDISDTLKSFSESEEKINTLTTENENLRQKYRDRFFSGGGDPKKDISEENKQDERPKTFDDLFKEV